MSAHEPVPSGRGSVSMWYALFGGPVAWFLGLCVAYFVVSPSCDVHDELPLHLISLVTLLIAAGAVVAGFLLWRSARPDWPDDGGGRIDRVRFVAAIGMIIAALFSIVIIAQWAATATHQPCWTLPRLPDSPDARVQPTGDPASPLAWRAFHIAQDGDHAARHGRYSAR